MEQGLIYINNNVFETLLAISEDEQSKGLMFRDWPPPAMSFIYATPKINKFWMNKTPSPLDIIFCNNGKITQIHKGESFSTKIIGNDEFSDLVIELPYGTAKSSGISLNDNVGLVKPTKEELKKIIALRY